MHDIKQILAIAVREARTELGLSQEKLAETLNMDTRTILNIDRLLYTSPSPRDA